MLLMGKNAFFQYHIDDMKRKFGNVEFLECSGAVVAHMNVDSDIVAKELKYPCRINAFIAMICTRGEIAFSSHLSEHRLEKNMMFVSSATILEFHASRDCELYMLAFDGNFVAEQNIDLQLVMPMIPSINKDLILHVSDNHIERIIKAFDGFYNEFGGRPATRFSNLIIGHTLCAIIYRICESVSLNSPIKPALGVKDRSAEYFERLMKLLSENFRTERSVEFYADKMNLTPKHLSRVIRNFTGKSVHQWIDNIVVLEIKNLLRYSDLSIQQISIELNFPNPSFMGQYFKRITGKTPGEFKRER